MVFPSKIQVMLRIRFSIKIEIIYEPEILSIKCILMLLQLFVVINSTDIRLDCL